MVRRVVARVVSAIGLIAAAVALTVGLAPGGASAGAKVTGLQVAGSGMPSTITVKTTNQDLFDRLYSEVSWLATATPQTAAPRASSLGAKYTVTVMVANKPAQTYDLYPMAVGGPRAHRSSKQPNGKKTADGWFYGRLTMSESLRVAGAPLKAKADVVAGGIGGGDGADQVQDVDPMTTAHQVVDQFRQLFLLNGAVLVVILVGLAGIAFLIRRRV